MSKLKFGIRENNFGTKFQAPTTTLRKSSIDKSVNKAAFEPCV
jgi:hypothetical protein